VTRAASRTNRDRRLPRRAAERAFTLLEVMVAFGILALALGGLILFDVAAVRKAEKALELRDTSVMADTIFRRVVYEGNRLWPDGHAGTADVFYGEYIGLKGVARDRWANYRIVIERRRGMIVGTDPSGHYDPIFEESERGTEPTAGGTTSGTGSTPGTGTDTGAGEQGWLVTMNVFFGDDQMDPVHSLRSILPLQPDEEEER
jgi:type II secretory pathway pseudopilin PulG